MVIFHYQTVELDCSGQVKGLAKEGLNLSAIRKLLTQGSFCFTCNFISRLLLIILIIIITIFG